ncbi:hypothetical protein RS84_00020 [Microbacterium hydrocarbonoxydans]|uniref:Uncharacterized protein n=1 Tax=Microbacterium hydrocarbonoxydans TaxID=273678 RepID=A0A0M2HS71_9MICO|nr:hypothetical protein [Microbacterium hydrocarbonoxydans]KJL49546.1 hypothetical protein RS84_00020 [Microbacterium hydrocarbonoxydans]
MTEKKRLAVWSDESMQQADGTYRIAVCEADEPGFWTLEVAFADLEAAEAYAEGINTARGLSAADVLDIRVSSMAAHNAGWRASDDELLRGE